MIPKNHMLLKLNKTIDFSFIYELTKVLYCKSNGRPCFVFQNANYWLSYGIKLDCQLCEEIQLNLAYRWFCDQQLRYRYGEFLR